MLLLILVGLAFESLCAQAPLIKILLATTNVLKRDAVHEAFVLLFPEHSIHIDTAKADPGIRYGQPFGTQQTFGAAMIRIDRCLENIREQQCYTYIIAVENGVFSVIDVDYVKYSDTACVVILELETQRREMAFSTSRLYPWQMVTDMHKQGIERAVIGHKVGQFYGDDKPLSANVPLLSRKEQVIQATTSALLALKNIPTQ